MDGIELAAWIQQLQRDNKLYRFYKSKQWKHLKEKILKTYHHECLWCKEKGRINEAVTVHHVQHVTKYPELALSEHYTYNGKCYKNLIPLCHDCHDQAHDRMKWRPKPKPLNEERW